MSEQPSPSKSPLSKVGRGLDLTRRIVVNSLFVALLVAAVVLLLRRGGPEVPKTAALVLRPTGAIVEQLSGDRMERLRGRLLGNATDETLLKDLLDAIEAGAADERLQVLLLDLSRMGAARMTSLAELAEAIDAFSATGKRVIASADSYDQYSYALAAHADEIWLHEMGMVMLEGFGRYRMYYRDLLDRLEVDWHVFRVGEYKSAVEPYLRDDMSPEDREAALEWLGDLWRHYLDDVSAARGIEREALESYAVGIVERLEADGGDTARAALEAGLVDHAAPRDALRDHLVELVGTEKKGTSFTRIGHGAYLETLKDRFGREAAGDLVAVVVARGTILDGTQPPGKIGGDSTAALIRQAREDEKVKAIVLRVDSGGGSAFASEVIRRELELARADGIPVVSSMAGVAASGGYWITMASDEVWAYPTTITGSIGIFGMFPNYHKPLARHLGIRVDGVGTTRFAGAIRPDRPLDPEVGRAIQLVIDQGYREFIGKAATARGTTPEAIDEVARGRVWSGEDAFAVGLVDGLGDLGDAIAAAARLAELGDDYRVRWIEKKRDWKQELLANLLETTAELRAEEAADRPSPTEAALRAALHQLETVTELNDPRGVYAWFPCDGL